MILEDKETGKTYAMIDLTDDSTKYKGFLKRKEDNGVETLGELTILKGGEEVFRCKTLELPWKDNKVSISCIPKGVYNVTPYSSTAYPDTYEVMQVPGRTYILIHWGNYYTNTEGCILVGKEYADINSDGEIDITSSRDTVKALKEATEYNDFKLYII